jgi:hypothetical protein
MKQCCIQRYCIKTKTKKTPFLAHSILHSAMPWKYVFNPIVNVLRFKTPPRVLPMWMTTASPRVSSPLQLWGTNLNQRQVKNSKELSFENKSMALGRRQENVINSQIGHAWAVEWMRLAGCSLYTYTVCTYSIQGRFFICAYCNSVRSRVIYQLASVINY